MLLIGLALLATGVVVYLSQQRPPGGTPARPFIMEGVRVVQPVFLAPRRLNLNTASAAELVSLPGIGEVLAGRILAHREEHGLFSSIDALCAVSGIGPKVLEAIRELVTVESEPVDPRNDQ